MSLEDANLEEPEEFGKVLEPFPGMALMEDKVRDTSIHSTHF